MALGVDAHLLHETMTSPAASRSASPLTPVRDESPAKSAGEPEANAAASDANESDDSPAPEAAAEGSSPAQAQAASEPSTSAAGTPAPTANPPLPPLPAAIPTASAGDWQAVWSPAHNAYYFYNAKTNETTWTNPLVPDASSSASPGPSTAAGAQTAASTSAATSSLYALQAAAAAQGIDPSLAHLDPSLLASTSSTPQAFTYTAKFNARTGAFARPDGRDPSHVSEYERARRMSEAYFDVGQWEKDLEQRKEEEAESKKRKKPTKKDLVRFMLGPSLVGDVCLTNIACAGEV